MAATKFPLPNPQQAHAAIVGIHKRAFLGRLRQHGVAPANEKEAAALLDLGIGLMAYDDGAAEKAASASFDYGDGPCAQALFAFDRLVGNAGAPGFEGMGGKQASLMGNISEPALPQSLVDSAYQAAFSLAQDPRYYGAAVVKRAENEKAMAEYIKAYGEAAAQAS